MPSKIVAEDNPPDPSIPGRSELQDNSASTSTSTSTPVSPSSKHRIPLPTPEAPTSLDDLLNSPHNPAHAASTSQAKSTIRGAPPNDERRRNGFHLWRTESEDAKKARLRQAMQEAEAHEASQWSVQSKLPRTWQRIIAKFRAPPSLSIYRESDAAASDVDSHRPEGTQDPLVTLPEPKLTRLGLVILTLSLAGAQLAWTLELAYGTPYLLSLGLSEQSTSLVWLAGPLSGLIAQPVVGSLSDASSSSFRRRKYMIISAVLLMLSTVTLAFSIPLSTFLVDVFGGGLADWDPRRNELVLTTTQAISVAAFWILDFALNGLQASSRALILDTAPSEQQSVANAWHGRMTHTGNVVGYLCGWVDLASWKGLRWLGGGQFRRFAMVSLLGMIACVTVTVTFIQERTFDQSLAQQRRDARDCSVWQQAKITVANVWQAIRRLPRPVRRICIVQLFAFMGWFPFLFYGTTYVVQIAEYQRMMHHKRRYADNDDLLRLLGENPSSGQHDSNSDKDAERGSFAMLLFALVALTSGALLPYFSLAGEKRHSDGSGSIQLPPDEVDEHSSYGAADVENGQDAATWLMNAHRRQEPEPKLSMWRRAVRGLRQGLTLRTFWTLASLTFATLMLAGTMWAKTVEQATLVIALVGLPWSVAAWAPFAMVGEFVREAEEGESPFEFEGDHWSPARTRARARERSLRKSRRESLTAPIASATDGTGPGFGSPETVPSPLSIGSGVAQGRRASRSIRYIDPHSSPHARRLSQTHGRSGLASPASGEEGARERIRASLLDCAPLPHNFAQQRGQRRDHSVEVYNEEDDYIETSSISPEDLETPDGLSRDPNDSHSGSIGGGTILGIHNLAIVAPQFIVAIISSLIFRTVASSSGSNGIHLVLDGDLISALSQNTHGEASIATLSQSSVGIQNPALGTAWVLRFGGLMAILAALATRFIPLTLSERNQRRAYFSSATRAAQDTDRDDFE
ncbi:MFS general substrate transporter [Testicularia cyperi]|uniref:MFS general substrate transporter n=1 Tax=Testicularia cyperi TaxID=1882483 RepID=A0A317XQF1_9BASI|nr:MFS general substrate transporter [Testicularia cyperi]